MFTGIVEATGILESLSRTAEGGRLAVRAPEIVASLKPGSSIAVNGCCLTAVELSEATVVMDLSAETLRRTAFGEMKSGRRVNLERPLRAGAELGGHFVQGHIDGVGQVTRLVPEGQNWPGSSTDRQGPEASRESAERGWWLSVRVPAELARYVVPKGSLAIDGISLTVAAWNDGVADFAVIPFTYTHTNVRDLAVGDAVNVECDILAKYLERLLEARREPAPTRLTVEELVRQGF